MKKPASSRTSIALERLTAVGREVRRYDLRSKHARSGRTLESHDDSNHELQNLRSDYHDDGDDDEKDDDEDEEEDAEEGEEGITIK